MASSGSILNRVAISRNLSGRLHNVSTISIAFKLGVYDFHYFFFWVQDEHVAYIHFKMNVRISCHGVDIKF